MKKYIFLSRFFFIFKINSVYFLTFLLKYRCLTAKSKSVLAAIKLFSVFVYCLLRSLLHNYYLHQSYCHPEHRIAYNKNILTTYYNKIQLVPLFPFLLLVEYCCHSCIALLFQHVNIRGNLSNNMPLLFKFSRKQRTKSNLVTPSKYEVKIIGDFQCFHISDCFSAIL